MLVANEVLVVNEVDGIEDGDKLIEKNRKLSKTGKLFKSQKSAKSRKKLSKIENLSNFDAEKNGPSFLTFDIRIIFYHLWLTFTKASILQHFDPGYYIEIKIDASDYAISDMLNQLASETRSDEVVITTDLGQ